MVLITQAAVKRLTTAAQSAGGENGSILSGGFYIIRDVASYYLKVDCNKSITTHV